MQSRNPGEGRALQVQLGLDHHHIPLSGDTLVFLVPLYGWLLEPLVSLLVKALLAHTAMP